MTDIDNYVELRNRAIAQTHHEDRMLGERMRNFLMVTAFLVAAYGLVGRSGGRVEIYLMWAVPIFGLLLAMFFLRTGVRTCQAIRLWYVTALWAEKQAEMIGTAKEFTPYHRVREPYYKKQLRSDPFWRLFIDPNAVHGLWLPGLAGFFWIGLLYAPLLSMLKWTYWQFLFAGIVVLSVVWVLWLAVLQRNLRERLQPDTIGDLFKPRDANKPHVK